jgi:hypothetical protein
MRLPQPGGPYPRIYIPQEQDGPVIPPGTVKVKVILRPTDSRPIGQSVLVSGTHLGLATNFSILSLIILDSWGFVNVGRPL